MLYSLRLSLSLSLSCRIAAACSLLFSLTSSCCLLFAPPPCRPVPCPCPVPFIDLLGSFELLQLLFFSSFIFYNSLLSLSLSLSFSIFCLRMRPSVGICYQRTTSLLRNAPLRSAVASRPLARSHRSLSFSFPIKYLSLYISLIILRSAVLPPCALCLLVRSNFQPHFYTALFSSLLTRRYNSNG